MPEPAKAVPTRDAARLLFLGVAGATPCYRAHVHRETEAQRAERRQQRIDEAEMLEEAEACRIRGVPFDEAEWREERVQERLAERRRAAMAEGRAAAHDDE
jgi:hypothetical protein